MIPGLGKSRLGKGAPAWRGCSGTSAEKKKPAAAMNFRPRRSPIKDAMVPVELTAHLFAFFPSLEGRQLAFEARTVKEIIQHLDQLAPGLGYYLCDELGALRPHVNIFIGNERILDRQHQSDRVPSGARVLVMQALSGG